MTHPAVSRRFLALLVTACVASHVPETGSAQTTDALPPLAKVRAVVTGPPSFTIRGTLLRNTSDSIVIGGLRVGVPSAYAKSGLQRLEVSHERRSSEDAFARGAKVGALVGGACDLVGREQWVAVPIR